MKKILLFPGIDPKDKESAVQGIFKRHNGKKFDAILVYFSKSINESTRQQDTLFLPHKFKRSKLLPELAKFLELDDFDFIIVRNLFNIVKQLRKTRIKAKLGFWESFPHSYRRVEKAALENRALIRKRLEYFFVSKKERRLLEKCDFYLPITQKHKDTFYPDIRLPFFPTPMGFDFTDYQLFDKPVNENSPVEFVHIGAVSNLRRLDLINQGFLNARGDFLLSYYSGDNNEVTDEIKAIEDPRIQFKGYLPREKLFDEIKYADLGVCFIPHIRTYIASSPTKTFEYGAMGMALIGNYMPGYNDLFNEKSGFFCDFDPDQITAKVEEVLSCTKADLKEMGKRAYQQVRENCCYDSQADALLEFLDTLN